MKKSLFAILVIISLVLSFSGPNRPVQAISTFPLLDLDQDGISNTIENAGWYNLVGGPYKTNPNLADSDMDGLTDAEEKLFNTIPTDPHSPGISVRYQSAFKTFEYFNTTDPAYLSMVQGGNQYLLTEALVIRRGTKFKIAAMNTAAATLTITGQVPGMTELTKVRDPARGGWNVTIPSNGTVGTYSATITDGGWSKTMPIYVIFELPTGLTQAQIAAFLYDDDPANKRDEVAVWWRVKDYKYYYYNNTLYETTPPGPTDCVESSPGICSNERYHQDFGYAQAFWTEQFTKKVLLTFALPSIQGATSPHSAADLLSHKADASVRTNYEAQHNSFSSSTLIFIDPIQGYGTTGGACETNAGVYTSMLRSVGIASRTFNLDYNKTPGHQEEGNFGVFEYDHAVMMWVTGPGYAGNRWYAARTAIQAEAKWQTTPSWVGGINPMRPLDQVGIYDPVNSSRQFAKFQDKYSDLIQTVNEGWDWQNGSLGGGMVNTVWTAQGVPAVEYNNTNNPADPFLNRDYKWDSLRPLNMIYQSPFMDILNCQLWLGDTFAPGEWYDPGDPTANPPISADPRYYSNPLGRTASETYRLFYFPDPILPDPANPLENWPYNPQPTVCSPSSVNDPACTTAFKSGSLTCTPLPGQTLPDAQAAPLPAAQIPAPDVNTTVQFGKIISDSGVDENGDGRFDALVITVELTSTIAGEYQLGGWLRVGENEIRAEFGQVSLTPGTQTVQVAFDGQLIGDYQVDGSYQVDAVWAAPLDQAVSELVLPDEMAAYKTYTYTSGTYEASAFTMRAGFIADNFTYSTLNKNANGLADSITISVPLEIAIPGTFKVEGDLYDGQGDFVGHAIWTGSSQVASLNFSIAQTQPPYSLEHLMMVDAIGKNLDARYAPVYTINNLSGKVDPGKISFGSSSTSVSPQSVTPPAAFTATPVDLNSNGRYDQLLVTAKVNVTDQGGAYWMEGLLVDDHDLPIVWGVGDPQILGVGPNQTLQMTFDGRMLFDQLPLAVNQQFTLIAVKIFSGSPGQAILEADVPVTGFATAAYSRTQFEPISSANLFQDDMESGTAKWTTIGTSQWSQTNAVWHSRTSAWMATGSVTKDGKLTLAAPLNFTGYATPWLMFNTAHELAAGQSVNLEVSTNGTTWTTLKTYTGTTAYWSTELIDLSAYKNTAGVRIRFNAKSYAGSIWYIDDVFVNNGLAPTSQFYIPLIVR